MKKIIVPCICFMLVMTISPLVASGEVINELEKNDFRYDVAVMFLFQRLNPLWQIYFKYLDIVSFSIFEDSEEPEFLHANMKIRDFKYSELRSWYGFYWIYNDIRYFVGTTTHTKGEAISIYAGYFDEYGEGHSTLIDGEINEEDNTLTWIVPKDIIGNLEAGDELEEIHANTFLILQKNCKAKFPLFLAKDIARPLLRRGYTYAVQY